MPNQLSSAYVILAIVVQFVAVLVAIVRISYQLGQLNLKVDTMWDFLIRRAKLQGVRGGWGMMSSAFHINARSFEVIQPFLERFLPFYARLIKQQMAENDMYLAFEREFGDFIIEHICRPQNMGMGECLIIVVESCKVADAGKGDALNA